MGAVEVLAKPGGPYSVGELRQGLAGKVRAAAHARVRRPAEDRAAPSSTTPAIAALHPLLAPEMVLAIGASTGGTEAIASVLARLPASIPGTVITQHIPPEFSKAFASRLNDTCAMEVKEARDGDVVRPGLALVAPGDFHMVVRKMGGRMFVNVKTGPRVCYQRPSVDVLFHSVAEAAGAQAVGVLLTGMGSDGAQGMLRMRQAGARTIAQDEASCVVFGMPREAIALGAAEQVLSLHSIPEAILGSARQAATGQPAIAAGADRRVRFFAAAGMCAVFTCAIPLDSIAQETTLDGIRLENTASRPDRPYRRPALRTRATGGPRSREVSETRPAACVCGVTRRFRGRPVLVGDERDGDCRARR